MTEGPQLEAIEGGGKDPHREVSLSYTLKSARALQDALGRLGHFVRLNVRSERIEWCQDLIDANGEPSGKLTAWAELGDAKESSLRDRVATQFTYATQRGPAPLKYGRESWQDAILAICYPGRVDPFREYLENLPEWDGRHRIQRILYDLFSAELNALSEWASAHLVLGPIKRTYEPGAKLDQMVVLCGPQDLGKSTLLRQILPPAFPEWFSDSLNLADRTKERAETLLGRVIVEAGEMGGINRAELESLKAFITRQDDGTVRLAYARRARTMLRRCIVVGSADRTECLPNDPAGLRRFVPIECFTGSDIEDFMADNREQLWAEGLHRYREESRDVRLPRDLLKIQASTAERYRSRDVILEDAIALLTPTEGEAFTLAEIADRIGLSGRNGKAVTIAPADTKRLATALRVAGWSNDRVMRGGKRQRLWLPPLPTLPTMPS